MTAGQPDHLPPEWLAAYADGELTPRERAWVERWLADHPEARDLLDAQDALGPANTEYWAAVRAPRPSPRQWADTFAGIKARAPVRPKRAWAAWLGTVGLMATAATLLLTLPTADRPGPAARPEVLRPLVGSGAHDEPYTMATEADVRIVSLPEEAADLLLVGAHPLGETVLVLARADEVAVHVVGRDLAGRFPDVPADPDAPDAPIIWAPREP